MNQREYLVGLGLAKPGRGRFSAEAKAALEKAIADGITFDDGSATPKPPTTVKVRTVGGPKATSAPNTADVRSWAVQNGVKVSDRGRVPQAVTEAYSASQSGKPVEVTEKAKPGDRPLEPARAVPMGSKFIAEWTDDNGKPVKVAVGEREVCISCGNSLPWCYCARPFPLVFHRTGTQHRHVRRVVNA